ncbi:MAG: hypothetical protein H3C43_12885, partial [Leptonema sp. (in: Bacteria)]|nr:hypothetical protein [Leptonema sp. (in: bacteria)]
NLDGEFTSLWVMPYYQWSEPASSQKPVYSRGKFFPVLFYTADSTQYATSLQNKPDISKQEIDKSTFNIMLLSHHSKEQNNLDQSQQESHWWMLPLVYTGNSDDRQSSTDSLFALGYYSWNNTTKPANPTRYKPNKPINEDTNEHETDDDTNKTSEITDYSYNSELADTTSQSTGKMFPILFYWSNDLFESGKNENFWNIGLLWNHTRLTDEVGDSISLKQHLLPLYYHNINEKSSFWMVTPLYWQNRDFETEELYRISPIYYSHQWQEDQPGSEIANKRRTDWALMYYSWNHHDSEGETIFPFYYRTKNDEKEWKLYAMGAVTTGSAMLEFQQDSVFLDTDLYVGYGLLGMSNRLPIYDKSLFNKWFRGEKSPTTQKDKYDQVQVVGENTQTVSEENQVAEESHTTETLTHNKEDDSFDRENTKLYNKWTSFFGLSSYIQADSKRHFRIIPLAWLSWDTENTKDDVAFYFPGYANYQTNEEHYLAVFPFMLPVYGRHDKGDSYTMNIGGFGYIESYDADEQDFSRHIIWPFYKQYKNQVEEGSRLFPIYSNRTWTDEEGKHNRHFSLVHYRHSVEKENQKVPETTTVSPVYISGSSDESNWYFLPIPLLYRSTEIKGDT